MITTASGDLLNADVDALVNTVNCVGVMGKGIALQFKRHYPDVFKEYERACKRGDVSIGRMNVIPTGRLDGPKYIINFPTKRHWRAPSKLEYIEEGLSNLHKTIQELGIRSIAIPPLGTGNGGLSWSAVEPMIISKLGDLENVDVRLYAPSLSTRGLPGRVNVTMTWGRAVLLHLLQSYVERRAQVEPWEDWSGASHLEIQKLMYFANILDPRLRLDFEPDRYGPYSERVRHLVQEMEGTFLKGHGDGTTPVLSLEPIALSSRGESELMAYADTSEKDIDGLVRAVLDRIEGYEGAYGLELLASTHWALTHQDAGSDTAATVRRWSNRKGRIFTDQHVHSAEDHLRHLSTV